MRRFLSALAAAALLANTAHASFSPAQKCQRDKNKLAGKYEYCRQKAEAKSAVSGRTAALGKCLDKYAAKWRLTESTAGGACPSMGDQAAIQGVIDTTTTNIATALAGGVLPDCAGDLLGCQGDLGTCTMRSSTTQANLTTCQSVLATCQAAPQGQLLKTGESTCGNSSGASIACAGTGQDGELQKGLVRDYRDNGDGTITDTRTGLMWEKLSDDGSIHDKDAMYTWANAFTTKVVALNFRHGFAGHTDWRLPNLSELQSLVNYGARHPLIDAAFNTGCVASCTILTCSCTQSNRYWSSSIYQQSPGYAWYVYFYSGQIDVFDQTTELYVRAVRGGS